MSLETDLRTACLAYGPLETLVGQRFMQMPLLEDQDYPCIAFTRIWSPRMYTQSGDAGIAVARVQYDCWDTTDTGAFDLADKLIAALATFTLAGGTGRPNFVINQFTSPDPEGDPAFFRVIVEARHWFIP